MVIGTENVGLRREPNVGGVEADDARHGDAKAAGASKGEGLEPVRHGRPGAAADSRQRARPDAAFTVGPPNQRPARPPSL